MDGRQAQVDEFERRLGCPLPDDYRRFLLAGPVPTWTEEESPANPHTALLHSFFDLGVEGDRDLAVQLDARRGDLPEWLIGIGEWFGVLIGLGVSGPGRGRVYQWSWDDGEERELAPSFDAFLAEHRAGEARWDVPRR